MEKRLGRLIDILTALENEIARYEKVISEKRDERIYGKDHGFKDPRYWRNWQSPDTDPSKSRRDILPVEEEKLVKDLYRKLAREFHPDLAEDEDDITYLKEKMAELNEAYSAKNLAVLKMLAIEAKIPPTPAARSFQNPKTEQAQISMEMARCQRRLNEIDNELADFHKHPTVQLSLDVKLARRQGRDLLREMAQDYKKKIERKTVERDYLKAQLEQTGLSPEGGE